MSRSEITVPMHPYSRDEQSGAGNCWCGRAQAHRVHPHEFEARAADPRLCVCGGFRAAEAHTMPRDLSPEQITG